MKSNVSKRDVLLFVLAQLVSISLLVLFLSQLLYNLSPMLQVAYIVFALMVAVADVLIIRKVMLSKASEPTVANQLKASLACFALLALSFLRFMTTEIHYQKVIALLVGLLSLLGALLFLWGIRYAKQGLEK